MVYYQARWKDCTLLPHIMCYLQGYLRELVGSMGTDITFEGVITVLDEYYNNVKTLDALNRELFQLWMADKKTVSDWGVCISKHLHILVALFPERFPPDHITELKSDCFYGGLSKQLKAMVTSLKAITNEKTYSDYLWVVWEVEKEEMMETSWSSATASTSKPRAPSFFPLQKFNGSQLAQTPSVWMAHLEEKSTDEEEGIDNEDPDGIEGMTEDFIVHLARKVKDAQQMEKHYYHYESPDHFICDYPQLAGWRQMHL